MVHTYRELLADRLRYNGKKTQKKNLEVVQKGIPYLEKTKGLDPRMKTQLKKNGVSLQKIMKIEHLEELRHQIKEKNRDVSPEVQTESDFIDLETHRLRVRIYNRSEEIKPVLIFFHSGGFFARDLEVMENPCKRLAQLSGAVVVAVEYRLAPEHPFPAALEDGVAAVRYVVKCAGQLRIDVNKIGLAGNSVGANLAIGVQGAIQKEAPVRYLGLICPLVDLSDVSREIWKLNYCDLTEDQDLIREELTAMRKSLYFIQNVYLKDLQEADSRLVSPLLKKNKKELPPLSVITAEFDFLRLQGETFAEQAALDGGPVRHINYKGMTHGFIKKIGYYPQAEDALREIAEDYQSHIT